jgi:hypothetical protein
VIARFGYPMSAMAILLLWFSAICRVLVSVLSIVTFMALGAVVIAIWCVTDIVRAIIRLNCCDCGTMKR